jgi:hypothetical protein
MSFLASSVGLISRGLMSALARFLSPKEIIVDIGMLPTSFVADNLKKKNMEYAFARRDRVIASRGKGWDIAVGRRKWILTEHYVDRLGELILLCKDKST